MKIVSWNVNGLRAALRKGGWDSLSGLNPDVICLQEIRARSDQLTGVQHSLWADYHAAWHPAERAGYSGVLTLSRGSPDTVALGTGVGEFDREGRLIRSGYPEFTLFNIYFPNGKRDLSRVPFKLNFYEKILEMVADHHGRGEAVILTGDFNTAHREIDLKNPVANQNTTGFLPEERAWIDQYLAHGLVDIFRLRHPEVAQYTWWTYRYGARARNVGWRLDYFLISEALAAQVQSAEILDQVFGSDHCPIALTLG